MYCFIMIMLILYIIHWGRGCRYDDYVVSCGIPSQYLIEV